MSEEEKIKQVKSAIWFMKEDKYNVNTFVKAIEGLIELYNKAQAKLTEYEKQLDLDYVDENYVRKELYNKEKEKNKELIEGQLETLEKILFPELMKKYISKDKIREKIKEYDGLKEMDLQAYEEQIKPLLELLEEE